MSGKVLYDGGEGPKTQSIEAVKNLIEYLTGAKCQELPTIFKLSHGWQLTRSSKGDCYYMSSKEACSCPGFFYRRTCRHVKALRDEEQPKAEQLSESQAFARRIVEAMES